GAAAGCARAGSRRWRGRPLQALNCYYRSPDEPRGPNSPAPSRVPPGSAMTPRSLRRPALVLVLGLVLGATPALADLPGFTFLEVPAGARAAAMGGAYTSLAHGAEAVFWNPAGLVDVKGFEITGSHVEYF